MQNKFNRKLSEVQGASLDVMSCLLKYEWIYVCNMIYACNIDMYIQGHTYI